MYKHINSVSHTFGHRHGSENTIFADSIETTVLLPLLSDDGFKYTPLDTVLQA